MADRQLAIPLAGIKVLEFSHTVMVRTWTQCSRGFGAARGYGKG